MTVKKVINTLCMLFTIFISLSLLVNLYRYNDSSNRWAEDSDSFTIWLVLVVVVLVAILVPLFILRKAKANPTGKRPDPALLKKSCVNGILSGGLELLFFLIVTENMVLRFGLRALDMSLSEAGFLAGGYQICKEHLLMMAVVTLVQNIVNYITAEDRTAQTPRPAPDQTPSERDPSTAAEPAPEKPTYTIKVCPACGTAITENLLYCGHCGARLTPKH